MKQSTSVLDEHWLYTYRPPTVTRWTGRSDGPGAPRFHEKIKLLDLREEDPEGFPGLNIAILGFASDEGVRRNHGRAGAAEGPDHLREALANIPLHQLSGAHICDFGDIFCDGHNLEEAQKALTKTVQLLKEKGWMPVILGGGHEVVWGHYQGLRSIPLSVVNVDAHFDMRQPEEGKGTSGTSFWQMFHQEPIDPLPLLNVWGIQRQGNTEALFNEAKQAGAQILYAEDFLSGHEKTITKNIQSIIKAKRPIYLTICLDAFASAFAPGVSAPQPLGLIPQFVLPHLEALAESGLLTGLDVAELNPNYDKDNQTAKLGAQLLVSVLEKMKP